MMFSFAFAVCIIIVNKSPTKGPNWIMYSSIINSNVFHTWLLYPLSPHSFQMCFISSQMVSILSPVGLSIILASRALWNLVCLLLLFVGPSVLCTRLLLLSCTIVLFDFVYSLDLCIHCPYATLICCISPPLDVPNR